MPWRDELVRGLNEVQSLKGLKTQVLMEGSGGQDRAKCCQVGKWPERQTASARRSYSLPPGAPSVSPLLCCGKTQGSVVGETGCGVWGGDLGKRHCAAPSRSGPPAQGASALQRPQRRSQASSQQPGGTCGPGFRPVMASILMVRCFKGLLSQKRPEKPLGSLPHKTNEIISLCCAALSSGLPS